MKRLHNLVSAICTAGVLAISSTASAAAVSFNITGTQFTPGTGYGSATNEPNSVLDVRFSTSGFLPQTFSLSSLDPSKTFDFGTIAMFERQNSGGIDAIETDYLDVKATFTFVSPVGAPQMLTTNGHATTGSVTDNEVDFTIDWDPIFVSFGAAGQFSIDMLDMSFTGNGNGNPPSGQTLTQTATITLISEDTPTTPGGTPVPEPSTIALLGLGLLGAAFGRRKSGGGSA